MVHYPTVTPRNILAFRTITTILAQLEPKQKVENSYHELSGNERLEVKVSDALAHLAVVEHEIVALATERTHTKISVLVCASTPPHKDGPSAEPPVPTKYPTIIHAMAPEDLGGRTLYDYVDDLMGNWRSPTLASHLWILGQLIFPPQLQQDGALHDCNFLRKYTIATCYPKMARRLEHPLSNLYIESLRGVKDFPFHPNLPKDMPPTKIANDRVFLDQFVAATKIHPQIIKSSIANITLMLNNLPPVGEPFELYTSETCMEFHNLLVEILDRFRESIQKLKSLLSTKGSTPSTEDSEDVEHSLNRISVFAFALQKIASGYAFEMHLRNIQSLLADPRQSDTDNSMPNVEKKEGERELDEELAEILITDLDVPTPLWQTYRDWVRLMVVHFDAIGILVNYVTKTRTAPPYQSISVKILVAPPAGEDFLSWSDLLVDPKLFPIYDSGYFSFVTNQEILKFLKDALASIKLAERKKYLGQYVKIHWENRDGQHKLIPLKLEEIKKMPESDESKNFPDYAESVDEINDLVTKWADNHRNNRPENYAAVDDITNKVQSLYDTLCKQCDIMRFPFDLEPTKFRGTIHCEAYLASILHERTRNTMTDSEQFGKEVLEETKGFGRVIGVSKRCCPACSFLLSRLSNGPMPFITRGSYNTLSACTLPPWTPEGIVDSMNLSFGILLRRELIKLMNNPVWAKNRTQSVDSPRLSSLKGDWFDPKDFNLLCKLHI
ncbi:hypothetical protein BYT27DRAFT_7194791 [Phlegmacium glaucopus]|nr:hypothetical protein BYT27DRAFT_7194791 [Phlegmacium glaucopus]